MSRSSSGLSDGHRAKSRSIDLVRGKWEAMAADNGADIKPKRNSIAIPSSNNGRSMGPPPITPPSSSTLFNARAATETSDPLATWQKRDSSPVKRVPVSSQALRPAEAHPSISSMASVLSPDTTGDSTSTVGGRSQATEDRLAQARANALKRLEAKKKASGAVTSAPEPEPPSSVVSETPGRANVEPKKVPRTRYEPAKASPFENLFTPPHREDQSTPPMLATQTARLGTASTAVPAATSKTSSSTSNLASLISSLPSQSLSVAGPSGTSVKDKYGSLSRADGRRLGRHLPRIASSEHGPDPARRLPSAITSTPAGIVKKRSTDILAASTAPNLPSVPFEQSPSKRKSAYKIAPLHTGRSEVAGEEMKGLMKDVGALPSRGTVGADDGVTGQVSSYCIGGADI